ncbi:MAG: ribose 5-phosphate isomerase B [Thermoplasmatota archaeon]
MKISIGSDHGGYNLKEIIVQKLMNHGFEIIDRGSHDLYPVDYPDIAAVVSTDIMNGRADRGILICGTGIGMCNAASRFDGITAALCTNGYMARMARLHNDANILCMGGRVVGDEIAWEMTRIFLETDPLTDEKYVRRRKKVGDLH